jgi:fatty-acyl-CoA synthase
VDGEKVLAQRGTSLKDWRKETIPGMLRESASTWGGRTAVITEEDEKITFQELYDRACTLAIGLHKKGIKKGDHVATLMGGRPTYIISSYALLMIGAVVVPINFNFQPEEIAFVLDQSDARVLIMEDEINQVNYIERIKPISADLGSQEAENLRLRKLPELKNIISLSTSGKRYPGTIDFNDVFKSGSQEDISLVKRFLAERNNEDVGYILYTSGTTAFPKGAIRTQGSSLGIAYYMTVSPFRLTYRDVLLLFVPFFHIGGCIYNLLGPHICGATVVLMRSFDPGKALELIERYRVTFLSGFDTHFYRLTGHPRFQSTDVSSITKVRLATGPFWYDKVRELGIGREIVAHHYGFTEGTGVVMPAEETDYETRKNSNGRPFPGVELKIVDPQTGKPQPAETPGEICLKGWTLFKGYYKIPQQTMESMDEEGFFHTGDYGWMDSRGYLYYRGRYKQMVKTGGENVSQREVEALLESHPDIQSVQVIGLPDEEWGEAVTAVVQTRSARDLTVEEVKEFCRGRVAGFKIPKKVLNIQEAEWPVTRVGKIDKIKLRSWALGKIGIQGLG